MSVPRVSFLSNSKLIEALRQELINQTTMTEPEIIAGSPVEVERLGFELGDVVTLIGWIATGIEVIGIARAIISAAKKTKQSKLEITGPTARISIDIDGKSETEIVDLVRSALPFLK
jgi:hypothetical protein